MKRLLSAALALSLIGATAAQAEHFDRGGRQHERYDGGRNHGWGHERGWRHHDDGAGTAVAFGVGLIALTAILAANHDQDRDNDRYGPPPPPPSDYGPGPRDNYGPDQRDNYGPDER